MRLINSSVSTMLTPNPFIKIERVGRTCYKSSSAMTEETARQFYHTLVARKHFAMLEHATFVFKVSEDMYNHLYGYKYLNYSVEEFDSGETRYLISGNLRALNETQEISILSALYAIDPDLVYSLPREDFADGSLTKFYEDNIKVVNIDDISNIQVHAYKKHKYLTFHFICDRGVTHEIVRHRPASYAQESTRYCNYSKEKFGREITCIKPADYENWSDVCKLHFNLALDKSEEMYLQMTDEGRTPQEARAVLPNALKTEIVMTANCEEFDHFFDLRSKGTTGAPHPDMKRVADMAYHIYCKSTKFNS